MGVRKGEDEQVPLFYQCQNCQRLEEYSFLLLAKSSDFKLAIEVSPSEYLIVFLFWQYVKLAH